MLVHLTSKIPPNFPDRVGGHLHEKKFTRALPITKSSSSNNRDTENSFMLNPCPSIPSKVKWRCPARDPRDAPTLPGRPPRLSVDRRAPPMADTALLLAVADRLVAGWLCCCRRSCLLAWSTCASALCSLAAAQSTKSVILTPLFIQPSSHTFNKNVYCNIYSGFNAGIYQKQI